MRKLIDYGRICLLIIFSFVIGSSSVCAEECDYRDKAAFDKIAGAVLANYEIVENNGRYSIIINVYNIVEDLYVAMDVTGYPEDTTETVTQYITYNMSTNGSYSLQVNDITHIAKYNFRVMSNTCTTFIRQFNFKKPMRNKFHDNDVCMYQEVLDYYYCKEWITDEIELDDKRVIEKIQNERLRNTTTTTTRCFSCEQAEADALKLAELKRIKMYVIIGISIGIVVDILVIILLIVRIRRYSI